MSTKSEIQDLLRFLAQDAKVPLPAAMGKIKELQSASLTSPELLAKVNVKAVCEIFRDEKVAKQVLNAAKRVTKKRAAPDEPATSPSKRSKSLIGEAPMTPAALERSLELPTVEEDEQTLRKTVIITNRAPLVLAFAVMLLKYTMPDQPPSSRLSLAQAIMSMNSRSKAVSIGLEKGVSAEEEGWGQGQPKARIMGREVRVLKRWGYEWKENPSGQESTPSTASTLREEDDETKESVEKPGPEPALWGLDLEALRSSNNSTNSLKRESNTGGLPIYTAQSARDYLMKSFASPSPSTDDNKPPAKKVSTASAAAAKELNLAMLLNALDLLYSSWAHVLSWEELDRRAWGWYIRVRPDVQSGVAGWGGKGQLNLSEVLDLRRKG